MVHKYAINLSFPIFTLYLSFFTYNNKTQSNQGKKHMQDKEKLEIIEATIKAVKGDYATDRLIQDCADKLSLSTKEVKDILKEHDSSILKREKN